MARQAGAKFTQFDLTPQMIEAGVAALRRELGATQETRSTLPDFDREVVLRVVQATLRRRAIYRLVSPPVH